MKWLARQMADLYEILFHPSRWMARPRPTRTHPISADDLIYRR